MGILYPEPLRLGLSYHLLVFKRDGGLAVVHAVPDVVFILQDAFYLCYRPLIPFGFLCSLKYMGEGAVSLEIYPRRGGNLFLHQYPCDFRCSCTVQGKLKYPFDNPLGIRVNQKVSRLLRVLSIP